MPEELTELSARARLNQYIPGSLGVVVLDHARDAKSLYIGAVTHAEMGLKIRAHGDTIEAVCNSLEAQYDSWRDRQNR